MHSQNFSNKFSFWTFLKSNKCPKPFFFHRTLVESFLWGVPPLLGFHPLYFQLNDRVTVSSVTQFLSVSVTVTVQLHLLDNDEFGKINVFGLLCRWSSCWRWCWYWCWHGSYSHGCRIE